MASYEDVDRSLKKEKVMDGGKLFVEFIVGLFFSILTLIVFGDTVFGFLLHQENRLRFRMLVGLWPEHPKAQERVDSILYERAVALEHARAQERDFFAEPGILDAPDLLQRLEAMLSTQYLAEQQFRNAQFTARNNGLVAHSNFRDYLK